MFLKINRNIRDISVVLTAILFFQSCSFMTGTEIARLKIRETSNEVLHIAESKRIFLKRGDEISFWTDMDIEYHNDLMLVYSIEVVRDTMKMDVFKMDALHTNPTMMEVKTVLQDKTSWSYTGKLKEFVIELDGNYLFRAVVNASSNPSLVIHKADIVIKK